jgi:hypothetical protein
MDEMRRDEPGSRQAILRSGQGAVIGSSNGRCGQPSHLLTGGADV